MKYLYQQMLAFFAVIMTVLVILGFSFLKFTTDTVQENLESQLSSYANTIIENHLVENAEWAELLLHNQGVRIYVTDTNKQIISPKRDKGKYLNISDADLKELTKGNEVSSKGDSPIDLLGNKNKQLWVLVPFVYTETQEFAGIVYVDAPMSNIKGSISELKKNLYFALVISTICALILSFVLAQYQVKRINRLRSATHRISKGDFDVHLESKDRDEFDDLAEDFNTMASSLKESNEEIERQENRRRQFMADAAHEMRTPLTTINGLLEGLEYDVFPEEQKKRSITLMQNETRRLIRLVNENLDYEKIRSNQITLSRYTFNVHDALESIVQQLSGKAEESGNKLTLDCPRELTVYADYDRFVQVIVNIVQNAIQFTKDGQISVIGLAGLKETVIEITDTGIGMTAEEVKNIWERYYKADVSRKNTKFGESGLGLAIVQQLMNLHDGKVTVESVPDQGTTFRLSFPKEVIEEGTTEKLENPDLKA